MVFSLVDMVWARMRRAAILAQIGRRRQLFILTG